MAIELIRDTDNPVLNIFAGKAWLIKPGHGKDSDAGYEWSLYSPEDAPENPRTEKSAIDLLKVEMVRLFDKTEKLPDKLEITLPCKSDAANYGGVKQVEIFELSGGLYYDPKILDQGFDKMDQGDFTEALDEATKPGWRVTGAQKGRWVGGVGSVLSVGGMYTAATIAGTAVQTQAVIGALTVGVVGGIAGGAILGGFVGLGIALVVWAAGSKKVSGHNVKSASRKIFEKLRCLEEYKECDRNILVPADKDCPRT